MKFHIVLIGLLFSLPCIGQTDYSFLEGTWNQEEYGYLPCDAEVYEEFKITSDDKNLGPFSLTFSKDSIYLEFKSEPAEAYPYAVHALGQNGFTIKMKLKKRFLKKQRYKYFFVEEWTQNSLELNEITSGCINTKKGTQTPYNEVIYSMVKKGSNGNTAHEVVGIWGVKNNSELFDSDSLVLERLSFVPDNQTTSIQMQYQPDANEGALVLKAPNIAPVIEKFDRWKISGNELHWFNQRFTNSGLPQDVLVKFKYSLIGEKLVLEKIKE